MRARNGPPMVDQDGGRRAIRPFANGISGEIAGPEAAPVGVITARGG